MISAADIFKKRDIVQYRVPVFNPNMTSPISVVLSEHHLNYVKMSAGVLISNYGDENEYSMLISNVREMTIAIDNLNKLMHKTLSTLMNNTSVYWINTYNIDSYVLNSLTINIVFNDGTALNIVNIDSTKAADNFERLEFDYQCNHIAEFLVGRNVRYVNTSYAGHETSTLFSKIGLATDASSTGDVVIVQKCNYNITTERWNLKHNVHYIFQDTTITVSGNVVLQPSAVFYPLNPKGIFTDAESGNATTVKIFGSLNFNFSGETNDIFSSFGFSWGCISTYYQNTKIFCEFNKFDWIGRVSREPISSYVHIYGGSVILKGWTSINARIYDSDAYSLSIYPTKWDYDVLFVSNQFNSDNILAFGFDVNTNIYLRGGVYDNTFITDGNQYCKYNFVVVQLNTSFLLNEDYELNLWRAFVLGTTIPSIASVFLVNAYSYMQSYAKVITDTTYIVESAPRIIIDPSLEVYRGNLLLTLQRINTLYYERTGNSITLLMYPVTNANRYIVYINGEPMFPIDTLFCEYFSYTFVVSEGYNYKVKAFSDTEETEFSNEVYINTI